MNRAVLALAVATLSWWCAGCASPGYPTAPYDAVRTTTPRSDLGEFQLTRVVVENTLDVAGSFHRIKLTVDGIVHLRPADPPVTVHPIPTIDRCVMDDGTDITMLHQSQTPGQADRRSSPFSSGTNRIGVDLTRNVSSSFLNVPPRSYRSIRTLEGSYRAARPTRIEMIRIPFANDTPATSESGWTGVVQGLTAEGSSRNPARITVTKPGVGLPGDLAGPRLLSIELIDEDGMVASTVDSRRSSPHLDGVIVEFEGFNPIRARDGNAAKPPTAIRIEFVSEVEEFRIPFAYRNIRLTR